MKTARHLSFLALALVFVACGPDTTQLQADVTALDKTWTETTAAVEKWSQNLLTEQGQFQSMLNAIEIPADAKAKLKPAEAARLDSIASNAQVQVSQFADIQGEVSAFVTSWQEKTEALQALKDQLAAKKIEDLPKATQEVTALAEAAAAAKTTLGEWDQTLDAVKASALEALTAYKAVAGPLINPAAKK
ncbi:MAG: hypothetical protein SF053_05685 [Bacteroidia bacterium]|nr:hypothetical protein [Bacteroidia bacterium]